MKEWQEWEFTIMRNRHNEFQLDNFTTIDIAGFSILGAVYRDTHKGIIILNHFIGWWRYEEWWL